VMRWLGSLPLAAQRLGLATVVALALATFFGVLDASSSDWTWNWDRFVGAIVIGIVIMFPALYLGDLLLRRAYKRKSGDFPQPNEKKSHARDGD
jgi:hypothetical protein